MGCSIKCVNSKWTSLRNQYSREKRNITGMRTGSGANDIYATKWYGFKEMESLMDGNKPEQTYDNISEDSSSLPMPRPQSTPTPPLLQPPSSITPPLLPPPNVPTPPPNVPTPPLLHRPNTSTSLLPQPNNGPTPPAKRKMNNRNTIYNEAMDTIKTIREHRARRNELVIKHDDEISAYGLYIAAQIRSFRPIVQSKIKLDIQNLLYKYELENYRQNSSMSDHSYYSSGNQNPD